MPRRSKSPKKSIRKRSKSKSKRTFHGRGATQKPAPRFRRRTIAPRLSARHYYDSTGNIGDACYVSGKLKKLVLRANGSPYWAECTPNIQSKHGRCVLNCRDPAGR